VHHLQFFLRSAQKMRCNSSYLIEGIGRAAGI
jgi:hypothetical protein